MIVPGATEVKYFYHQDALGSVVALSQFDSGLGYASFVEKYSYSAFGETTICDGSGTPRTPNQSAYDNSYMFTGREYESEIGLYYYRARFYNPAIGRFLQTDPIGYKSSMNLYAYVGNNPLNFIDPMGLKIILSENATWRDKLAYHWAIYNLSKSALFKNTYEYLKREDTPVVSIAFPTSREKADNTGHWPSGNGSLIYWNRYQKMETNRGLQSSFMGLAQGK